MIREHASGAGAPGRASRSGEGRRGPRTDPATRRTRSEERGLAHALGVTRVARLTGLDRTGIEVASAVRPRGHVLQVTNGKGERREEAVAGALMEAAELAAAEDATAEAWDSAAALAGRLGPAAVLSPRALAPGGGVEAWEEVRLAWRMGRDLDTGAAVLVPAGAVHVPPAGGPPLGPALLRWTSNGMGAGRDRERALLHALLEAVERDRVARALPEGFTPREIAARLIDPASLGRAAPRTAALVKGIEERGFQVHLLDLTGAAAGRAGGTATRPPAAPAAPLAPRVAGPQPRPRRRLRSRPPLATAPAEVDLPCAAALVVDVEGGPVPVAAGYACRLSRDAALRAALLEAAQSRATEIHGAREDVAVGDRHAAAALRPILAAARAGRDPARMPDVRAPSAEAAVRGVLSRLRGAGFSRATAVDVGAPAGIAVVKVIVPGLLLSELL